MTVALEHAYEVLGLQPILEFEQASMINHTSRIMLTARSEGKQLLTKMFPRRIGISTQVLVECLIDLIEYEKGTSGTGREDDFVIVLGRGHSRVEVKKMNAQAGIFYKKLGGRHLVQFGEGPPNLWILRWEEKKHLLGSQYNSNRFFYDPVRNYMSGPLRLVREIPERPIKRSKDGEMIYAALDQSGRRIALVTMEQASFICSRSFHPILRDGVWNRPLNTFP